MKSVKVLFMGKPMREIYPHATGWQVFKYRVAKFLRKVLFYSILAGLLVVGFFIARSYFPVTVYSVEEKIIQVENKAPVLDRIARCESGNTHYENGQVIMRGNTNKSVDVGKYQINMSIWGKTASKMGYNLVEEKDNEAFAIYLFKTYGSEPWIHSKTCWNK